MHVRQGSTSAWKCTCILMIISLGLISKVALLGEFLKSLKYFFNSFTSNDHIDKFKPSEFTWHLFLHIFFLAQTLRYYICPQGSPNNNKYASQNFTCFHFNNRGNTSYNFIPGDKSGTWNTVIIVKSTVALT